MTGPPGAGKSTLIERVVLDWVQEGHKVAVLAIDPSSRRTGGSVLGDKTRMGRIAQLPEVYVRPSPSQLHLGGLGPRTPLACALLERAGYQRIVVETVGVGQSEVGVSSMVDRLLLVALPGAGDEVQGIKRGLMEEVDLVAVNKADLGQAKAAVATLRSALRVFRRKVPVFGVSALTGEGWEGFRAELGRATEARPERRHAGELQAFEERAVRAVEQLFEEFGGEKLQALRRGLAAGRLDLLQALPQLVALTEDWRRRLHGAEKSGEP